jgi:hypothetical protein
MAETKVVYKGVSGTTLLFLVFLVLKLIHVIDWSWWWVTTPLWIPIGIVLAVLIVILIGMIITN